MLPTAMAEAVLASRHSAELSRAAEDELQQFIALLPERLSEHASLPTPEEVQATAPVPAVDAESVGSALRPASASRSGPQHAACSTVVTGAMMTAFESAQRWPEVCCRLSGLLALRTCTQERWHALGPPIVPALMCLRTYLESLTHTGLAGSPPEPAWC